MKTNNLFGFAAIVCGLALSMTSCSKKDNPVEPETPVTPPAPTPAEPEIVQATVTFEKATLNDQSFWCGEVNDNCVDSGYGITYPCVYKEEGVEFPVTFGVSYWSGYAISARTETGFTMGDYSPTGMPDQFNNVTGKAHGGNNFAVVQPYGETITFDKAVNLKGFWYTNSSWVVDAILNGDGMTTGKFEADDWFLFQIMPTPADGSASGALAKIYLAKDGDYVKTWQYCDLSDLDAFKNIKALNFGFDGTKSNDWGITTPAYVCIDDIVFEYQK